MNIILTKPDEIKTIGTPFVGNTMDNDTIFW